MSLFLVKSIYPIYVLCGFILMYNGSVNVMIALSRQFFRFCDLSNKNDLAHNFSGEELNSHLGLSAVA